MNRGFKTILLVFLIICCTATAFAQEIPRADSFFLLRKKGLLRKLGQSIYREAEPENPVKVVDPFLAFKGMTIRSISIAPTGFNKAKTDTIKGFKKVAANLAEALHKNTLPDVIRKNLFFREGDRLLPLLLSDNEKFLRDLPYLRDAVISVQPVPGYENSVDVVIITRDVFSIGGSIAVSSVTRGKIVLREDNAAGTGNKFEITGLYDKIRNPKYGLGAAVIKRNIQRSFINWAAGFNTFNPAFNSGRKEETSFFTSFDKPLVSRYTQWTGAASVAFFRTDNAYLSDSLYRQEFRYQSLNADFWAGYNIGAVNRKEDDGGKRLRHFVALRSFYNIFYKVPEKFSTVYNYGYADINGFLASYSLYRQNFYKTNFIYGFGRNEDIPEGVNATIVSGYTNKENLRRGYYGLEFDASHYSAKGFFTSYSMRAGTFINKKSFEDADLLIAVNRFTKLYTLGKYWRNRNFVSLNFTKQFNTVLSTPLFLESVYGLPYFINSNRISDMRATVKVETVFYNLKKILGFRLAPFIFSDAVFLKPINDPLRYTTGYSAIGGGVRTRNENLTFGTVELKGYFFPRVNDGMKNWKIEIGTNLKFRYNSSFIRRPDFVSPN